MSINRYSLAPSEARKLALFGQGLLRSREFGSGCKATHRAIQQLSYVQIDTISVVERAHHHTCWNRVESYQSSHLDDLLKQGQLFEYWAHAASYLPIDGFRYSLRRKQSFASGEAHWHQKDVAMCRRVLRRIEQEGPLRALDFKRNTAGPSGGWWEWKPAKIALEQLFMEGELMVAERRGFQKVYDLTERVLPATVDTSMPSETEQLRYRIERYLACHGLGTLSEMAYLQKGIKPKLAQVCQQLLENQEIAVVDVSGRQYFSSVALLAKLSKPLSRTKVKILSPFDNLVIQRQRLKDLFEFDYQLECYVPESKRIYGYFVLPILWGQRMAARMNARVDRKSAKLTVSDLFIETKQAADFIDHFIPSLRAFRDFNNASRIDLLNVSTEMGLMRQEKIEALTRELNRQ